MRPVMRFYASGVPKAVIDRWSTEYDLGTRRALTRFYRNSDRVVTSTLMPELRRLDRPALVLWGGRNRFVPVKHADDLRQSFPGAEVVVLEGRGHYAHLEDPDGVAAHLIPFLEEQLAR
jgi:pimeloyl-ACP methyl ester carboxylesterase